MTRRKRIYDKVVAQHFEEDRQVLFLMGPQQVGKTTTSRGSDTHAFQIVQNLPYKDVGYFTFQRPVVAPAQTLLSQLI